MSNHVNHCIGGRRSPSLIEHLIEYFDWHVEVLITEGVPPDRIAEALRLATVRVEILHGGGANQDGQARSPRPARYEAAVTSERRSGESFL
jgi:hypothetical protein